MKLTPRLAATVILARPAPPGFELYMTRRSRHSAFAADAFVFPGGTVDAEDFSPATAARTLGLARERTAEAFHRTTPPDVPSGEARIDDAAAAALLAAALRELFEEAGILIARTRDGSPVDAERVRSHDVQEARPPIGNGELRFADFLERYDWFADATGLTLFSHWITPASEPRRYDTYFFFALAPAGQTGLADARETHEGLWIAPRDALVRHRDRRFHLVYPTVKHLERLAVFESADAVAAFARAKPVLTVLPLPAPDGGDFTMPVALENAW